MKKNEKNIAEAEYFSDLDLQSVTNNRICKHPDFSHEGSTASHCKRADYSVRDYLMVKGVGRLDDIRCRPSSRHDWELVIRKNGKACRIIGETKVGTGAVRYGISAEAVACDPDLIYPGVDYIAYCVDSKKLKAHPELMASLFRVFTREQFLQVLTDCGKKGLQSSLRVHKTLTGTWQLEIVAWSTPQCATRLGKYEEWVEVNSIPTLEQFRMELRG